jgi:PAS domain S-box-containing protein
LGGFSVAGLAGTEFQYAHNLRIGTNSKMLGLFRMETRNQASAGESSSSLPTGEEELRILNQQLQQQADQLRSLNRELVDREQRLRLSIEVGRVGVWVWDTTGSVHTLDWSQRLKEIFGLSPDAEVTRELFLECVHPEDRERVDWAIMQSLSGVNAGFYNIEYRIIHPGDNSLRWVTAQGQAFFDAAGQSIRFIGAVVDISDRKQVEEFTSRLNLELETRISNRTKDLEEINQSLQTEVQERINLESKLRESQRVVRGQVETLIEILNSLSTELNPDRFLQHVLCTIAKQMGGQSVSVLSRNNDDTLTLEAVFEENQLHAPEENGTFPTHDQSLWAEAMRTGTDCLVTELDRDPIWFRFVNRPRSEGVPRLNDRTAPFVVDMHKRLKAQGVVLSLAIPMVTSGRVSGFIGIRFTKRREFPPEEIDLSRALAHQTALAIQLMRLSHESQQTAVMAERNRMARDIHDTLAQGFTGIIAQLQAAKGATQLADAAAHIERAEDLARSSLGEARRSVRALRPRSLHEATLCEALENMLRTGANDSGLRTEFLFEGEQHPIPPEWEEGLLRVVQESLTNAIKHSQARNFRATLSFEALRIRLKLVDDGRGFNPEDEHEGFGLIGMKERVEQMGGEFVIHSQPGHGAETVITLQCPALPKPTNE